MEGFITFLFFFVIFMWAMGKLFPLLLAWFIKRKMKGFAGYWSNISRSGNDPYGEKEQKKQEGKVVISDIPKQEKVIDKEIGEYVDFEE